MWNLKLSGKTLICCHVVSCTDSFAILRDTKKKKLFFFVFMFTRNILQIFILKKSQNFCFCFIDLDILARGRRMTQATLADFESVYFFGLVLLGSACWSEDDTFHVSDDRNKSCAMIHPRCKPSLTRCIWMLPCLHSIRWCLCVCFIDSRLSAKNSLDFHLNRKSWFFFLFSFGAWLLIND